MRADAWAKDSFASVGGEATRSALALLYRRPRTMMEILPCLVTPAASPALRTFSSWLPSPPPPPGAPARLEGRRQHLRACAQPQALLPVRVLDRPEAGAGSGAGTVNRWCVVEDVSESQTGDRGGQDILVGRGDVAWWGGGYI